MINKTNNMNCSLEKNREHNRNGSYDLLRIIATVCVIAIHTNWLYFEKSYESYSSDASWIIQSLINIITRFSVPCFVMISGAYNLNNRANADIRYFYKKTSYRIFLPFAVVLLSEVIATLLMNLILHRELGSGLKGLFTTGIYNLWYMYMLFGVYLLTPLIVNLKTVLSRNAYMRFAVLMLVWAVVSQSASTQTMAYGIGVVVAFLGYYLTGDVIRSVTCECAIESKRKMILCSLAAGLFAVGVTFWARAAGINYYIENWSVNFFSPTIVLYSIGVFSVFSVIKIKSGAGLSWLSKKTYLIYLFHTMILIILHYVIKQKIRNELSAIALLIILTFVLSLIAALCFEKVWNFICRKFTIEEKWKSMKIWKG